MKNEDKLAYVFKFTQLGRGKVWSRLRELARKQGPPRVLLPLCELAPEDDCDGHHAPPLCWEHLLAHSAGGWGLLGSPKYKQSSRWRGWECAKLTVALMFIAEVGAILGLGAVFLVTARYSARLGWAWGEGGRTAWNEPEPGGGIRGVLGLEESRCSWSLIFRY